MTQDESTLLYYTIANNVVSIGTNDKECHSNADPNFQCSPFLAIPEQIENKNVEIISDSAFRFHEKLIKVIIPWTVKSIGWDAFAYITTLKSVTFQENSHLTTFDAGVFYHCHSLEFLRLPYSLQTIESYSLSMNGLKQLIYCGKNEMTNQIIFNDAYSSVTHYPKQIIVSKNYPFDHFGSFTQLSKVSYCEIPLPYKCHTINSKNFIRLTYFLVNFAIFE